MKYFHVAAILLICSYFSVSIATEPTLPPYHQYFVTGKIERISNGKKGFFVVSLVGKFSRINTDSLVDLSGTFRPQKNENKTFITDSSGSFSILISSMEKADSLAIKISAPDKQNVIGPLFSVGRASATFTIEYTQPREGCECEYSTEAHKQSVIEYYRYDFFNAIITIP